MRHKYRHQGPISFEVEHEVELPPIEISLWLNKNSKCGAIWQEKDNRYVLYTLAVDGQCYPSYGDGWNEPRDPAYAEIEGVTVLKIEIHRDVGLYDTKTVIEPGFIGPMEPGIVPIGGHFELPPKEMERLEEECSTQHHDAWEAMCDYYGV